MQHTLEELCQIETILLLEAVNISYLSQEHQVGVYVLPEAEAKTLAASIFPMNAVQHALKYSGFVFYILFYLPTNYYVSYASGIGREKNDK